VYGMPCQLLGENDDAAAIKKSKLEVTYSLDCLDTFFIKDTIN